MLDLIPPYDTHKIGIVYVDKNQVSTISVHTYIHTNTHTYIQTYIHTHTYIHAYIHTYIHTHSQTQEQDILSNTFGSSRYVEFLRGLGQLLWLADCPPGVVYLGGLDRSGTDGKFAYFYQDDITQGMSVCLSVT